MFGQTLVNPSQPHLLRTWKERTTTKGICVLVRSRSLICAFTSLSPATCSNSSSSSQVASYCLTLVAGYCKACAFKSLASNPSDYHHQQQQPQTCHTEWDLRITHVYYYQCD
jgi:hypothetical protein